MNPTSNALRRFRAFVSYSHADRAFARRLHRRLESFRLPRQLRVPNESPQLGKIYLDREELGAAEDLPTAIERALADSEALIVVVSAASLRSRWVRAEIVAFRKLRTDGQILCIAAAGQGGLASHELLRDCASPGTSFIEMPREPLVVNVDDLGFEDASLALIAALFARDFDELRNRERQRLRIRQRQWTAGIAAIALVVMLLGLLSIAAAIKSNRERDRALRGQSELLVALSAEALRTGDATLATRLALAALPSGKRNRPYVWQASVALSRSAQHLRAVAPLEHPGEPMQLLASSSLNPGRRLAVSRHGRLTIEEPNGSTEMISLPEDGKGFDTVLYDRANGLVLALNRTQLISWNEATRSILIEPITERPGCMTKAPDGSALAMTYSSRIDILRLPDLRVAHQIPLPSGLIGTCSIYSRGRSNAFVAMEKEGMHLVKAFDLIDRIWKPVGPLSDIALNMAITHDDSAIAVAVGDNAVIFWELDGTPELRRLATAEFPRMMMPTSLGFVDQRRRLLVGDNAGRVHFYDAATLQRTEAFAAHQDSVISLVIDPDEIRVHTSDVMGVGISWTISPLLEQWTPQGMPSRAYESVASRSVNLVVSNSFDDHVVQWTPEQMSRPLAIHHPCEDALLANDISEDGDWLAAGCESGEIFIWRSRDDSATPELRHRANAATVDVNFDRLGNLLFASRHGEFGLLQRDGRIIENDIADTLSSIVEIPNSSLVLVVNMRGDAYVYDLITNVEIRRLRALMSTQVANQNMLPGVVSDSGRFAAVSGADDRVRFWKLADGELIADAPFARGLRNALVAGPHDQIAFIEGGVVYTWSPDQKNPRALPGTFPSSAVAFVPNRTRQIATAAGRQAIWLWDLESEQPFAQVALTSRGPDDGIGRDLLFYGDNFAMVGLTTSRGPAFARMPTESSVLASNLARYSPSIARSLTNNDLQRFALPMDSILEQETAPVFSFSPLEVLTSEALSLLGKLDHMTQPQNTAHALEEQ
jgi:WD40 repeat protein